MALTGKQKDLIRESWAKVDHKKHGVVFYQKLLTAHPEYMPMFKKFGGKDLATLVETEDAEFVKQATLTFAAIQKAVDNLDNGENMAKVLHALGKRHVNYGVFEAQFLAVQPVIIDTLNAGLGGMSPELTAAWETALKTICQMCVDGQK